MKALLTSLFLSLPGLAMAQGETISVRDAWIALAPPMVKSHAAYLEVENAGTETRALISVRAEGYHMAHLHHSVEKDGVAMMQSMDQISLEPGQTISFAPGGLHIMLMHPMASQKEGDSVALTLEFANGEKVPVLAIVRHAHEGS